MIVSLTFIPCTIGITNTMTLAGKNKNQVTPASQNGSSRNTLHVSSKEHSRDVSFGEPILASLGAIYGWTLLGLHPVEALVTFLPVLGAQRAIAMALFDTKASYFEAALKFVGKKAQQLENMVNPDKKLVKEFYEAATYLTKSYKYKWATDPRSIAGQSLFLKPFDDTKLAKKNLYIIHSLLKKDMGNKYPNVVKELEKYFTTGVYSPKNLQPPKVPDFKIPPIKIPDIKLPKPKLKPIKKADITPVTQAKKTKPPAKVKIIEPKIDKKVVEPAPSPTLSPSIANVTKESTS